MAPLLEVKNLKTHFFTADGVVKAVDGISYEVAEGEVVGIVGESGCGKSVGAMSIMRLVASPPGRIVDGEVLFGGEDLVQMDEKEMRNIRGNNISMVFQEPMTSLNPVLTVGRQLTETLELHQNMNKSESRARASELLTMVGIPDADTRLDDYPHQFSGGMRQRVMIAMALSCDPKLIIADEPTTALDVTIQAQILELMQDLARDLGTALIIITHNLGVVARYADRVIVMYAGKIVETSTAVEIYKNPLHPYTRGLLNSVPRLDADDDTRERLEAIEGMPPNLGNRPAGCGFQSNCSEPVEECLTGEPVLREEEPNHWVAYCAHCEEEYGCKWFPRDS
ncbi:MAG: peptide ABC transporter ATP-binding protein [Chloroflexi bacterium]|nr:peptide ABC transporter ATP-binding protein [Chloroflexota bacterium]|tara:strand:- start:1663 stop:2676 length:1014 start_codon:yes stop_codon:yes gene_type:complete